MKRVSMVVWNDFLNDARVLKEAETLQKAGYAVTVHALLAPGVTPGFEYLESGVAVRRVARNPLRPAARQRVDVSGGAVLGKFGRLQKIWKIATRAMTHAALLINMVRARPDVVHAHDVNTLPTAWLAACLARARLIYDAHEISTSREGYNSFRTLVGWVEKHLMPRAHGTITTTEARAKFFARAYKVARPVVLQNRPRFQVPVESDRLRRALGLQNDWPIVLYQGGVQQGRGLERLVSVVSGVPEAYFVFVGSGRLDATLRRMVTELKLTERVHFIPTVPLAELHSYTSSADVGVQPIENTCLNHFTTDSNKLFEYVQAGLPVIASDLPEIRRVVREHDLGVLITPGDSAALEAALNELVGNAAQRTHLRERAERAAQTLSWEAQEHQLVELYQRVLS